MNNFMLNTECKISENIMAKIFRQKLSLNENIFIRQHLRYCKFCAKKYELLQIIHTNFQWIKEKYLKILRQNELSRLLTKG